MFLPLNRFMNAFYGFLLTAFTSSIFDINERGIYSLKKSLDLFVFYEHNISIENAIGAISSLGENYDNLYNRTHSSL
jgi:hypothetical protein